jgi:hypothetical protein
MTDKVSSAVRLAIHEHLYVTICVWDKLGDMQANTPFDPPYYGCYVGSGGHEGNFGTVHLSLEHMGAGYLAHELMHLVADWILEFGLDLEEDNEKVCSLMGRLTAEFWEWFYDTYREASPGDTAGEIWRDTS